MSEPVPQPQADRLTRVLVALTAGAGRFAWPIVIAAVLATVILASYTAVNISIHTDTDEMIDSSLPFRQTYQQFNAAFPQLGDTFLVIVEGRIPEQADVAAEALLARLTAETGSVTGVYAPGFGPFFDTNGLLYLDVDELSNLSDRLAEAQPVLSTLAETPSLAGLGEIIDLAIDDAVDKGALTDDLAQVFDELSPVFQAHAAGRADPLSWQALFEDEEPSRRDLQRFIVVQPRLDPSRLQPARQALDRARALAAEVAGQFDGEVTIRFTGKIALNTEELKSVSEGAAAAGVLSLVLVALILGFGVRSAKLVLATLLTLVMGLVWTAAFAIATIGYLNIISVAFAVLFIGLGVDFAIHFGLRYQEERYLGADHMDGLTRAAAGVGQALALCAPTTALAFFAFTPTAYAGLSQLGLISGTGIFVSFFSAIILLPAVLTVLRPGMAGRRRSVAAAASSAFVMRFGRVAAVVGIGAGFAALFVLPSASFDFDPIRLKDPGTPSVQTFLDLAADSETSPYTVQVVADDRAAADALADRLKALPEVDRVVWLDSFVPDDQDEKLEIVDLTALFLSSVVDAPPADPAGADAAQDARALRDLTARLAELDGLDDPDGHAASVARFARASAAILAADGSIQRPTALHDALFRYWPRTLDRLQTSLAPGPVAVEDVPASIRSRYRDADGRLRMEVFPAGDLSDQEALRRFVNAISAIVPEATGSSVQRVNAGDIVVDAMRQATSIAAILIIVFLSLVLRRATSVVLVLLPVGLAAALTVAATVVLNIPFNFANVIVLPLLIGLGVDSAIHLVMRAREEHDGSKLLETSTPRAVLLSALTTIGSFGSLAISSHRGTASMGELLTVSISLTLICTLIVLPGLLNWRNNNQRRDIEREAD